MAAELLRIRRIAPYVVAKTVEEGGGKFGVGIDRIKAGTGDFTTGLGVPVHPFRVKFHAFPAIVDGGKNLAGPLRRADLEERAAAIAGGVGTKPLEKAVFAGREPLAFFLDAEHEPFGTGAIGEALVKGSHHGRCYLIPLLL